MNWKHKGLLTVILAATSLAMVAATPHIPPMEYSAPILELPALSIADCTTCGQEGCDPEQHWIITPLLNPGPDRRYEEYSHDCDDGWCSVAHPEGGGCASEEDALAVLDDKQRQELWEAATQGQPDDLSEWMVRGGESVSIHPERASLQVNGCAGNVVLSVPLTSEQLEVLGY